MSRSLKALITASVLIALLSVGVLISIWYCEQNDLFIGSLFTSVIGFLTVVIAIIIYKDQQLSQAKSHQELTHLQGQLRDRVFGVLSNFEHVCLQVERLIEEANAKPGSKLAIMMYWLWFGIDRSLYQNPTMGLDQLTVHDSRVRHLLAKRITDGLDTTVVVYNPMEEKAAVQLKTFIKKVMTWQIDRKGRESGETSTRNITDAEVDEFFGRYMADLTGVESLRRQFRDTKFRPLELRQVIPMLMFALEAPERGESLGLVYLGETDALAKGAKTGGFISADPRIVEVLMEQIVLKGESPEQA